MTPPARLLAHAESGRPLTVVEEAGSHPGKLLKGEK